MKLLLWIILFFLALVLEVALLPKFFGTGVPVLSFAVALISILFLEFWQGMFFAGVTGGIRDIVAIPSQSSHTVFFMLLFLLIWLFIRYSGWDEPARRIGALGLMFLLLPLLWNVSSFIAISLFDTSPSYIGFGDMFSVWFLIQSVFSVLFVVGFAWNLIRWSRRHKETIGSHLALS